MLHCMICAAPIVIRKASVKDLKYMVALLSEEIVGFDVSVSDKLKIKTTTPPFVKRLFKHFTTNVNTVKIDTELMDFASYTAANSTLFGFQMFTDLFIYPNSNVFKTSLMIKLFHQIKQFTLFKEVPNMEKKKWEYGVSCDINDIFLIDIFESISIINERGSSSFESFMFVKPSISSSIESFIINNQQKFQAFNWYLSKQTYKDTFRGDCDECLCISKLIH